jgi:hypothetical protein
LSELWIGPKYEGGFFGRRLLILAEAHPREAGSFRVGRGLSAELVPGYCKEEVKHRLFTDLCRLVLGRAAGRAACVAFLEGVALANLPAQTTGPRGGSSDADWQSMESDMARWLAQLAPQAVLLLGDQLAQKVTPALRASAAAPELMCVASHPAAPAFVFRGQLEQTAPLRTVSARPER